MPQRLGARLLPVVPAQGKDVAGGEVRAWSEPHRVDVVFCIVYTIHLLQSEPFGLVLTQEPVRVLPGIECSGG